MMHSHVVPGKPYFPGFSARSCNIWRQFEKMTAFTLWQNQYRIKENIERTTRGELMSDVETGSVSRRSLLRMIGTLAGSTAMYNAMTEMGFAQESGYAGPPKLGQAKPGSSVLILGAGIAGMVAAMELRDAGYKVQVLEYNNRAGGRNWSLYGGDTYTELGGATQHVQFDPGHYLNPGPWRIPYHHYGILHYANRLGVALEPFVQ